MSDIDQCVSKHLAKYGSSGKGNTSYLSNVICEEFIQLMADEAQRVITEEMLQAKYFGLILDTTSDVAHVDQLTLVVRYVSRDDDAAALEAFWGLY